MIKTPDTFKFEYSDLSELDKVVEKIISFSEDIKILIFEGEMGVGKTTMIKAICKYFNIEDNVTSPTFSIVNEYRSKNKIFYHFDFYRLKDETEAMDIGCEEYFYSDNYCFIEWPSRIENLLPEEKISICISVENNRRVVELFKNRTGNYN